MFSFRLLGFPVAVEPWFWITALLLGAGSPETLLPWVAAVFISVLAHELGHALLGRAYGLVPSIRLQAFGGVTEWNGARGILPPLKSALLSLAGPMAGFAFGALIYVLWQVVPLEGEFLMLFIYYLIWISVAWGVFNLLPILPLDGGNVMRQIIRAWNGRSNEGLTLRISVAFAGTAALYFLIYDSTFTAAWIGFMAYQNYEALQRYY